MSAAPERLLTTEECAALLQVRPQTLRRARVRGGFVPFVRVGSLVRYRPSDIAAFVESRRVTATSQAAAA
jgi:excisionase family DNA binding protein